MEQIEFPQDFSEFLKLLNAHHVEYLLIGGFAVAIHGYPRATADMDVWSRGIVPTPSGLSLASVNLVSTRQI